jgi:hypothetical protein
MKNLLLRHWPLKALILVAWILIFVVGETEPSNLTRDPDPPWLFLSTLPAALLAFAWANQSGVNRRGGAGALKYGHWILAVGTDVLVLTLSALALLVLFVIATPHYSGYTRRAVNSELVLAASAARHGISHAADRNGSLVGAGRCIKPPELGRTLDFAKVTDDGVIILHSARSESTVMFIPKMEQGKTLWQCRGFPAQAFPMMCRGEGDSWTRSEPSNEPDAFATACTK